MDEVTYTVIRRMRSGYDEDPSAIYDDYDEALAAYNQAIEEMKTDRSIAKVALFSLDGKVDMSEKSELQ